MPKNPYIPFYVGDWLKDPAVTDCSPATRGIWIDLLCSMHERQSSGKLVGNAEQLSRVSRCSVAQFNAAAADLLNTGAAEVFERNGVFTIICRRLKREAEISQKRAAAGSKSSAKQQQINEGDIETEIEGVSWMKEASFRKLWNEWNEHRKAIGKPNTILAKMKQIQMLANLGRDRAIAALNHSIANNWQGIYEPHQRYATNGAAKPNPRNLGIQQSSVDQGRLAQAAVAAMQKKLHTNEPTP